MTPTSEVVARLKPLHMADEPIAQAVVSSDQAERLRAVEAYIRANNALKSDALALISSLVAERDHMAKALEPLRHYVKCRQAMPMRGIGDSVHTIHVGSEFEAELTFPHLEAIAASIGGVNG